MEKGRDPRMTQQDKIVKLLDKYHIVIKASDEFPIDRAVPSGLVAEEIAAVQNEWISVEDRLPEEDGFYIVAFRTGGKYFSHFNNGIFRNVHSHQEYGVTAFGDDLTVTYWMPLPQPPER